MTPYKIIIVDAQPVKEALAAQAVLGNNKQRIRDASFTAVFAADLQPSARLEEAVRMERDAGKPVAYLQSMRTAVSLLTAGCEGPLGHEVKRRAVSLAAWATSLPTINTAEGWAFKNTALAIQTFILSATANGLATSPMEGFDDPTLRRILRIPDRYAIPAIVAVGYPAANAKPSQPSPRPPLESMTSWNTFSSSSSGTSRGGL